MNHSRARPTGTLQKRIFDSRGRVFDLRGMDMGPHPMRGADALIGQTTSRRGRRLYGGSRLYGPFLGQMNFNGSLINAACVNGAV